jgi:glycerate 2-kinase
MAEESGREHTWRILRHVVEQLDPRRQVAEAIELKDQLRVRSVPRSFDVAGRVVVVAVGKASIPMAAGALDALGDAVDSAVAVTKAGTPQAVSPPAELEVIEADHPVPSESSLLAGQRVRSLVSSLNEDDLVLMLISGGGSALVEDLVEGVSLDDLQSATDHLLRAGATINELNAVRRRISRIKGGRLAGAAAPATIVNLIVSDVLNSPLQDIASGPTVEPPELDETFKSVMQRSDLIDGLPASVRSALDKQDAARPKWPDNVAGTVILSDAEMAARAAIDAAVGLGYRTQSLGFDFQGEAREFGRTWATIARHAASDRQAFPLPLALVGAGELTVTVRGDGVGGRNTEAALAAAREIAGWDGITITSFATDGDDGLSSCAGGIVDGSTLERCRANDIDADHALERNDSATALKVAGDSIDIGATGTNVNDIYLALVHSTGDRGR